MDVIWWLVMRPLSLLSFVFFAWWRPLRAIVDFVVELCWRGFVWILAIASLPVRIVTALQRERTLEVHLHELQAQLEDAVWEKKELEQQLQRVVKEQKVIETLFEEIEEEHEKVLSRIDELENDLQDIKKEKFQLKEIQGKAQWDYKACSDKIGELDEGIPLSSNFEIPSWSTGHKGSVAVLQDILMQGDSCGELKKNKPQQTLVKSSLLSQPYTTEKLPRDSIIDEILERRRVVALSRSLFSSVMSLIVGMIVWEAEDPCMPLVAALFTVVGMSLNSVVQFFSTIKNKPASDAVALLSINWFILGTVTYPALPGVARMLAPRIIGLTDRVVIWLGFSS